MAEEIGMKMKEVDLVDLKLNLLLNSKIEGMEKTLREIEKNPYNFNNFVNILDIPAKSFKGNIQTPNRFIFECNKLANDKKISNEDRVLFALAGDVMEVPGVSGNQEVMKVALDIYNLAKAPEKITKVIIPEKIAGQLIEDFGKKSLVEKVKNFVKAIKAEPREESFEPIGRPEAREIHEFVVAISTTELRSVDLDYDKIIHRNELTEEQKNLLSIYRVNYEEHNDFILKHKPGIKFF